MRLATPLLLLLLLMGCSALPMARSGRDESADEVGQLKQRVLELQRQAAKDEVEIARLREQLQAARQAGTPKTGSGPSASAERRPPPPSPTPPSTPSAGGGEATKVKAPQPIESEDLVAPEPLANGTGPVGATEAITPEVQALYDRGYTAFHERRYGDAESTFDEFLSKYPHSELADNAAYWIGEARLQQQDTKGALEAFKATVEKYPKGNKVPDALLKVGECLESLGDTDSARLSYQEVVKRFPNTAASEVAKEREAGLK